MNESFRRPGRQGVTLVELLVVVTLLAILATLSVVFLPPLVSNDNRLRASDQVAQALLIAKQRAKREGRPIGVRLLLNPDDPTLADELAFIEQPEPFGGGTCQSVDSTGQVVTFASVDFTGGSTFLDEYLVQPGDYLEVRGGGTVHRVNAVTATTLTLASALTTDATSFTATTSYRVLRQPRLLPNEPSQLVRNDVAIDLTLSRNIPTRTLPGAGTSVYEVLFAPSGAVTGQGTGGGKVILWLHDKNDATADPTTSTLLAVQTRTGSIAAHPVALGVDPYAYTSDGRASGL
jgi:prepilin-type N-terminal cleavage/methylation domain-containing protein